MLKIPIRVKQFPQFVQQMLQRTHVLARPLKYQPVFRLCYFSCESYFRYLVCALHSLVAIASDIRYEVIVFSDTDMPLTPAQIKILENLIPGVRVIPWPKSMGWGAEQIGWIWKAYELAAQGANDDDIIARIDSDVFFFNDTIFRAVARSKSDLVGDGHYVDFKFCQGGCYFFRASAVRKILALHKEQPIETLVSNLDVIVEDVAATYFARLLKLKVWMTWIMMFPDELRNAGRLNRWHRWKFSCAHFVMKNKAAMIDAYEREMLNASSIPQFRALIETT